MSDKPTPKDLRGLFGSGEIDRGWCRHPAFDWDQAEPEMIDAVTETIAENPPDKPAGMVTNVWAMEILEELSDRGYVLVPRRR